MAEFEDAEDVLNDSSVETEADTEEIGEPSQVRAIYVSHCCAVLLWHTPDYSASRHANDISFHIIENLQFEGEIVARTHTTDPFFPLSPLQPNTQYSFQIKTVVSNTNLASSFSENVMITTPSAPDNDQSALVSELQNKNAYLVQSVRENEEFIADILENRTVAARKPPTTADNETKQSESDGEANDDNDGTDRVFDLKIELRSQTDLFNDAQSKNDDLIEQIMALTEENNALKNPTIDEESHNQTQSDIRALEDTIADMGGKNDTLVQENIAFRERLESFQMDPNAIAEETHNAVQLATMVAEKEALMVELSQMKDSYASARTRVESLQSDNADLKRNNSKLTDAMSGLHILSETLKEVKADNTRLKAENTQLHQYTTPNIAPIADMVEGSVAEFGSQSRLQLQSQTQSHTIMQSIDDNSVVTMTESVIMPASRHYSGGTAPDIAFGGGDIDPVPSVESGGSENGTGDGISLVESVEEHPSVYTAYKPPEPSSSALLYSDSTDV